MDRFYQIELRDRPAYWQDVGEQITIAGIVLQGPKDTTILHMPDTNVSDINGVINLRPTTEEWSNFIQHSDDPQVFIRDKTGGLKATMRKIRYVISGAVQQKIWAADNFSCVYCTKKMGDIQLTIDHFMPLELGGDNNPSNYLSACRKCNKDKGNLSPQQWCTDRGHNYDTLVNYLRSRKV